MLASRPRAATGYGRRASTYYEIHGNGEPVIFLHGLLGAGTYHWRDQYPVLARQYRCILPDLRGHGRTPPDGGFRDTPAQLAGDVLALLDRLQIGQAHVVGLSLGAYVGLHLGVHHSDRLLSLTLSGVVHYHDEEILRRLREQVEIFRGLKDDPRMQAMKERHVHWHWFDLVEAVHADLLERPVRWGAGELGRIAKPTLVLQGDRLLAELDSAVLMREAIPGAELCVLPGAGHTCQWDRPALYTAALLDFLARVPSMAARTVEHSS